MISLLISKIEHLKLLDCFIICFIFSDSMSTKTFCNIQPGHKLNFTKIGFVKFNLFCTSENR